MLKKRVIFTLLYDNGAFMLSRNFRLQRVGDMRWLLNNYNFSQVAFFIDELIVLDVTRGERDNRKFCDCVSILNQECFVPIAAGGGIRSVDNASQLFEYGADKIVINSLVEQEPSVVVDLASQFGKQSIVMAIDVKHNRNGYTVWVENGKKMIASPLYVYLEQLDGYPVGELYLNSIDRDGTGQGYDYSMLNELPENISQPVILAGGVGNYHHFSEGLRDRRVDAVATAHLFNFLGDGLEVARTNLEQEGFNLATWDGSKLMQLKNVLDHSGSSGNQYA